MNETLEAYGLASVGLIRGIYEMAEPATRAWIAIGAFVVAYDAIADKTLSEKVDEALESHRALTVGAIALTAGHLCNMIPEKYDVLHQVSMVTRRLCYGRN